MKIIDLFTSANANLWRNKGRTILTIIAIFIGAFTISLTAGVNIGVNDYIDKQVNGVGGEDQLFVQPQYDTGMAIGDSEPKEYNPDKGQGTQVSGLTKKDLDTVKGTKNIKAAEPYRMLSTDYIQGATAKKYEFSSTKGNNLTVDLEYGRQVSNKTNDYEIDLAPEFVKSLGYSSAKDALNKKVKLGVPAQVTGEIQELEAIIVGVRNVSVVQGGQSVVNAPLGNKIIEINETGLPEQMKDQYVMISAEMKPNLSDQQITTLKDKLKDDGYMANTVDDQIGMIRDFFGAITTVLMLFGGIALLAASFGIINTLYMSVQDRTREIGLMKAMGMGGGKIFLNFSFEALLIGFWGSLLGILGSMGAGVIINRIAEKSFLKTLTGFTLVQFDWPTALVIIGIVMLIAFLAGTFPANRAARLDPINALRYE